MRLGAQSCLVVDGSVSRLLYGKPTIDERHRHRWEVNDDYVRTFEELGLSVAGRSEDGLVEIIELPDQDWFVACQFHPEKSGRTGIRILENFVALAGAA